MKRASRKSRTFSGTGETTTGTPPRARPGRALRTVRARVPRSGMRTRGLLGGLLLLSSLPSLVGAQISPAPHAHDGDAPPAPAPDARPPSAPAPDAPSAQPPRAPDAPGMEPASASAGNANPPAREDTTEERFRQEVRLALDGYRAGRWREAREGFLKAYTVRPSAEALRMAGNASYELGQRAAAAGYLERALAQEENPLRPHRRVEAERVLGLIDAEVGRVELEITPEEARAYLDGIQIDLEASTTLRVPPGSHRLSFRARGYLPRHVDVEMHVGERQELRLRLEPVVLPEPTAEPEPLAGLASGRVASEPVAETPPESAEQPPEPDRGDARRRRRRRWLSITGALLLAGALLVPIVRRVGDSGTSSAVEGENTFGRDVQALRWGP